MKRTSPDENQAIMNNIEPCPRKKPKTPVPAEELPSMMQPITMPSSHTVQDIQPEIARVEVKRELTPVTIDLDGSDQGGSMSGFEGLSQEMAFIDTSVSTGFEGEVSYEDGQYYDEAMGHVSVTDDRVSKQPLIPELELIWTKCVHGQHRAMKGSHTALLSTK